MIWSPNLRIKAGSLNYHLRRCPHFKNSRLCSSRLSWALFNNKCQKLGSGSKTEKPYRVFDSNMEGPFPQRILEIPLLPRYFSQITPRNCLKFMFTPILPNHAGCQIDHSRNNAIFPIQFPFSRSKIYRITPSRFPLGGPLPTAAFQLTSVCLNLLKEISPRRKGGPNSRFHLCDGSGWIFRRIHT